MHYHTQRLIQYHAHFYPCRAPLWGHYLRQGGRAYWWHFGFFAHGGFGHGGGGLGLVIIAGIIAIVVFVVASGRRNDSRK
jgi:uncharacterized membrane protein